MVYDKKYEGGDDELDQIISKYSERYNAAREAGDAAGMREAHDQANMARNDYGYMAENARDDISYVQSLSGGGSSPGGSSGGSSGGGGTSGGFSYGSAPSYANKYQRQIDALTNSILGREAFSYDAESDPTYQQYRDSYTREGQRAMQDTLGQVSARTGGLSSSYATSAASQANDYYMSQLSDKIPELRQLAYSMYQDEGNNQRANLEMLLALESGDYSKYMTLLGQYNTDRGFDYGVHRDGVGDQRYENEWNYGVGRDAIGDQRYENEWNYGLERDALSDQRYEDETAYNRAQAAAKSGGGGSSGGRSSGGGNTTSTGSAAIDSLYEDMENSGMPQAFLAANYKQYGLAYSQLSSILSGYSEWQAGSTGSGAEVPNFGSYSEAVSYMKQNGVPGGQASGAMTEAEWKRRRASYQQTGQGGSEVSSYSSYSEYLTAFVRYCISTYGG